MATCGNRTPTATKPQVGEYEMIGSGRAAGGARARYLAACVLSAAAGCALAGQLTTLDPDAHYPEGPLWRDGKLLYVEYAQSNIKYWDGTRTAIYWHKDGCGANALIPFNGHLLVACYDSNSLAELDANAKEVRTIRADSSGKPFTGPNDFAADGRTITEIADTIHYSNGLTLTKDQQHLLVAEMLAGRVLDFPIGADGKLGPRTVWARLQDLAPPTPHEDAYNGPDGIKLGPDGNYYIAQNGSGRVLVVSGERKLVRTIDVPTPYVTNIAFGPDATGAVFVTGAFEQWKPPYPGAVYRWTQ